MRKRSKVKRQRDERQAVTRGEAAYPVREATNANALDDFLNQLWVRNASRRAVANFGVFEGPLTMQSGSFGGVCCCASMGEGRPRSAATQTWARFAFILECSTSKQFHAQCK
jgi:hypothetical protein